MAVVLGHIRWKYRHRRTFLVATWWCVASCLHTAYLRSTFSPPREPEPIVPLPSVVVALVALGFFAWELVGLARWRPMARWIFSGCLKFWSLMLLAQLVAALFTGSWSATGGWVAVCVLAVNGMVNAMLRSEPHEWPSGCARGNPYFYAARHR